MAKVRCEWCGNKCSPICGNTCCSIPCANKVEEREKLREEIFKHVGLGCSETSFEAMVSHNGGFKARRLKDELNNLHKEGFIDRSPMQVGSQLVPWIRPTAKASHISIHIPNTTPEERTPIQNKQTEQTIKHPIEKNIRDQVRIQNGNTTSLQTQEIGGDNVPRGYPKAKWEQMQREKEQQESMSQPFNNGVSTDREKQLENALSILDEVGDINLIALYFAAKKKYEAAQKEVKDLRLMLEEQEKEMVAIGEEYSELKLKLFKVS